MLDKPLITSCLDDRVLANVNRLRLLTQAGSTSRDCHGLIDADEYNTSWCIVLAEQQAAGLAVLGILESYGVDSLAP